MKGQIAKRAIITPPTSKEEAAEYIRQIGEHQRKVISQRAILEEKLEKIRQKEMPKIETEERIIEQLIKALYAYAQQNREELTEKGKLKTVSFPTGTIGWRVGKALVVLKGKKEEIIKRCKEAGFFQFIRVKEEIDKQAMLNEQEKASEIKGVTIKQREKFVIEPGVEKFGKIKISKNTEELK
ncbi:host-nuclease inhibitor Gam family protein [bacterium]|nr:host-nuclease inhibitor Gam family protein [bacterium]